MRWYLRQEGRIQDDGVNFLTKGQRTMKSIQQIKYMEDEKPATVAIVVVVYQITLPGRQLQ